MEKRQRLQENGRIVREIVLSKKKGPGVFF
jgi:hypothetical protein